MAISTKAMGLVLLVAGVACYFVVRERHPAATQSRTRRAVAAVEEREPSERHEAVPAVVEAPVTVVSYPVEPAPLDEPALMAKLRELGPTDPEQAIRLARDGNRRFPASSDAAERAWFVVKSLVSLQRFHEARDEAHVMVARFRGTSWAEDVERHLLVNPLDQPSREEQQEWERLDPAAQEP